MWDGKLKKWERTWKVDVKTAKDIMYWSSNIDGLLENEIKEMTGINEVPGFWQTWILTVGEFVTNQTIDPKLSSSEPINSNYMHSSGDADTPLRAPRLAVCSRPGCKNFIIFENGLRCISCDLEYQVTKSTRLVWFGLFIHDIEGLDTIVKHLNQFGAIPGHPIIRKNGRRYLLIPVNAFYPIAWPAKQPMVHYAKGIFTLPRIEWDKVNANYHMHKFGMMCLYTGISSGFNSYQESTMKDVLVKRALGHSNKLLKYCNGDMGAFLRVSPI